MLRHTASLGVHSVYQLVAFNINDQTRAPITCLSILHLVLSQWFLQSPVLTYKKVIDL